MIIVPESVCAELIGRDDAFRAVELARARGKSLRVEL